MKEVYEFRIYHEYTHALSFKQDEGLNLGTLVKVVKIAKKDPRFNKIGDLRKQLNKDNKGGPFSSWQITRYYAKEELESAKLFHVKIKKAFEPESERCGTIYDETTACEICKANATQIGYLRLKKGTIPKLDIARTLADEVVVSEKLVSAYKRRELKGAIFNPILFARETSSYSQILASSPEVELAKNTIAGGDPFVTIDSSPGGEFYIQGYKIVHPPQVYKCPLGHTIGANLLSEVHVLNSSVLNEYDFFASRQKIGARQGVLRQHPIYLCSPAFRKMVMEEKLTGFDFEVVYIDEE